MFIGKPYQLLNNYHHKSLLFRIAQQQESARNFSRQAPPKVIPTPSIIPPPQTPKPVDLTSSLLQTNLKQLTTKQYQPNVPQPINQRQPSQPSLPNYNLNMVNPSTNYTMPFDNQLALPPSTGWPTGTSNQSGNFNNKWANNQNNQGSMKQDWSAFESLLPTQTQNTTNNNNNVKKLSNSEMMDLLS